MKNNRLLYLLIIILLIWNVILTISLSHVSNTTPVSETTIVNNTINGYSSDITEVVTKIKSSNVTIATESSLGSGFIYSSDDENIYILSAYHVLSDGENISVLFANEISLEGSLVSYDIYNDLALVSVPKSFEVSPVTIGDVNEIKAGEFIFAVGTPSTSELSDSLSLGIISSPLQTITNNVKVDNKNIEYYLDDIQLSSLMTNGYSGSAVYNQAGEVIGIITMSMDDKEIFATPINEAVKFIENSLSENPLEIVPLNIKGNFIKDMEVYTKNYLGLNLEDNDGFYIEDVKLNSPFKDLGLKNGDIITSINGLTTNSYEELLNVKYSDLSTLNIEVIREGEVLNLVSSND